MLAPVVPRNRGRHHRRAQILSHRRQLRRVFTSPTDALAAARVRATAQADDGRVALAAVQVTQGRLGPDPLRAVLFGARCLRGAQQRGPRLRESR